MSYVEKITRMARLDFSRLPPTMPLPNLLETQKESYNPFLQKDVPPNKRKNIGLEAVFNSVFPIKGSNSNTTLEYLGYKLHEPPFSIKECRARDKTYAAPLQIKTRLVVRDADGEVIAVSKKNDGLIYVSDVPLMTDRGSFIINGTERVVVSQLHRSPGVIFSQVSVKNSAGKRIINSARIIPYRGSWLDFEFDTKDLLFMRIDRRRKLPATMMLSALGYSAEEILKIFFENSVYKRKSTDVYVTELHPQRLRGTVLSFDISKNGKVVVPAGRRVNPKQIQDLEKLNIKTIEVPGKHIHHQVLALNIVDKKTGELLYPANTVVDAEILEQLEAHGIDEIHTIYTNEIDCGAYISRTLREAENNYQDPVHEIFRLVRPGSPLIQAQEVFDSLFFDLNAYDLSSVGRMKLNHHLKLDTDPNCRVLTKEDIIEVMSQLIAIRNGKGTIDDVDNLGNRRVRAVGELAENQFRIGLVRIERVVRDRLNTIDVESLLPQEILNTKMIQGAMQEFFGSGQLSQFMDQSNPLAEVTHKRRVSALGPGGLTRERAGFEVRDVHPTHYGRLCPVETPEGPNIGLISSLAIYARTDKYGLIETPYRRVEKGRVTDSIDYLSALNENKYVIAQASAPLDKDGRFKEDVVAVRYNNESVMSSPENIDYMDVSPQQAMSVAATLVPFLEHDDANRALMGANMQRQAVPVIQLEAPLVGTGMENVVARDSGACVLAKRGGVVESVHSGRVVVRVNEKEIAESGSVVDIYNLVKHARSNQSTCINQRPWVKCGDRIVKGMLLADGHSVDKGDLALGRNIRIAFMPWNGYNYEDSILISERIAHEDKFTSIHIQELTCVALDTKLGPEEITPEIANVSDSRLSQLDASGVVHIGAEVGPGDVLVGKVTPKGETMLSPEDKLLRAIFGEKASDVKNTSLCVPPGTYGTVIDVQMAVRDRKDKEDDKRAMEIENHELASMSVDLDEELHIVNDASYGHLRKLLIGSTPISGTKGAIRKKKELTDEMLDEIKQSEWFDFRFADEALNSNIESLQKQLKTYKKQITERRAAQRSKITEEDLMAPGVLKKIKVYLAVKRYIQPGDKIAGRHGSKGVISSVVPVEDMPYDAHGEPVDMVLNPLGVPSRMNVGQILEAHLGLAAKELGRKVDKMVRKKADQAKIVEFLKKVYAIGNEDSAPDFEKMGAETSKQLIERLRNGVPMSTPVFDGCSEDKIRQLLKMADAPESGQITLYDGRTGDAYMRPVTVGYMYMMKLNHLVDDKMHARSTGPYSLVTQQPLGGKSHKGGQRFGEMEVWALEAYGAANILQEMLTVKSDNMQGRNRMYKNILDRNYKLDGDLPDSFQVLMREIRALGIHLELEQKNIMNDIPVNPDFIGQKDHKTLS
jgi:DNA-directed RNA polymerase subunit beta